MKKRVFALIFAAALTGACCVSCESDGESASNGGGTTDTSYSRPEISGRTRKERISAADQAAERVLTACNEALDSLKSSGENVDVEGWFDSDAAASSAELETIRTKTAEIAGDEEEAYSVYVKNGAAVAAVGLKIDFYGTYPAGLNHSNYYDKLGQEPTLEGAKTYALSLVGEN